MNIKIEHLKKAINNAIEKYSMLYGEDDIVINEDLYWIVPHDMLFDFSGGGDFPLEVGSFSDELQYISRASESISNADMNSLGYASAVLRYMSDRIIRENEISRD